MYIYVYMYKSVYMYICICIYVYIYIWHSRTYVLNIHIYIYTQSYIKWISLHGFICLVFICLIRDEETILKQFGIYDNILFANLVAIQILSLKSKFRGIFFNVCKALTSTFCLMVSVLNYRRWSKGYFFFTKVLKSSIYHFFFICDICLPDNESNPRLQNISGRYLAFSRLEVM